MNLRICKDAEDWAVQAADFIAETAQTAVAEEGCFTLVLTGGQAEPVYAALARPERASRVDWGRTFVFWGDESATPPDDPNTNHNLAKRALLDHVPIPAGNIFPMVTAAGSEETLADTYAQTLAEFFQLPVNAVPPRFDLVLLGLGTDGHMASLFPGAATLRVADAWVVSTPPGTLPPPVDRLSLTFPVINAAHHVAFLVSGAETAPAVADIIDGRYTLEQRPGAGVQPASGTLTWFLDEAAASRLTNKHLGA